jgi:hypothetical protein
VPTEFEREYGIINRVEWIFNNVLFTYPGFTLNKTEAEDYKEANRANLAEWKNWLESNDSDSYITPFLYGKIVPGTFIIDSIH